MEICGVVLLRAAAGTGHLSYQWLKNDREIPGATLPILSMPEVTIGTLGIYTCRVSNAAGTVMTQKCDVALSQSPPMIEEGPAARIEVGDGRIVRPSCSARTARTAVAPPLSLPPPPATLPLLSHAQPLGG
jgi:hypothetical protein